MLDPGPDEAGRDVLAQDVRTRIEGKGTLKHENKWGLRKMAYEIDKRTEADYRWFRFEASNELLDDLGHSLRIADGVLRFRVFKVDPDSPVMIPPSVAAPVHGASRDRDRGPQGGRPATVPADTDDESASEVVAEPSEPPSVDEPAEPAVETAVDEPAAAE
jgi:small subunit ribosomal protein S6